MAEDASTQNTTTGTIGGPVPTVSVPAARTSLDLATILGLTLAVGLIGIAIALGQSNASFFNVPSLFIVVFGTVAVTSISYTGAELASGWNVLRKSITRKVYKPRKFAESLLSIAVLAKKKGILALSSLEEQLNKELFLAHGIQMAIDGGKPEDIDYVLSQEIGSLIERHKRTASITKRAAEVAPAMGLIGTLVGLVQMLADLENPETIGPAMAVALLTTFYGAIMGTVVVGPLAVKLEKNSQDETMIRTMIRLTSVSIARQDNPRKLEMELNSALPPSEQVRYFD